MMFGKYPASGIEASTLVQSRVDGFNTGVTWKEKYTPGGPHVVYAHRWNDDPDWVAFCNHTKVCNQVWLEGFHDGLIERNKRRLLETVVREPAETGE